MTRRKKILEETFPPFILKELLLPFGHELKTGLKDIKF